MLCPRRFVESSQLFTDVGRMAFGSKVDVIAAPEVPVLRATPRAGTRTVSRKRLGKVDYLIGRLGKDGRAVDFAALEVQAVYFSGASIRPVLRHYLAHDRLPPGASRRPDWRSSAQKRLMPQLALRIPLFRRWGKKVFVAVDSQFFAALPPMSTVDTLANSEVTWVVYPFRLSRGRYTIGDPDFVYTTWDDVLTALREGTAPDPTEILNEIERKRGERGLKVLRT